MCDQFNDPVGMDISGRFESARILGSPPAPPPTWFSEKTVSHDSGAIRLAQQYLPIVATLPTPLLYTDTDKLQAHRSYNGKPPPR